MPNLTINGRNMSVEAANDTPLLWVQAVWKRFSYPNNCKQPGVMDLDATG